jgi:Cytochrome P460
MPLAREETMRLRVTITIATVVATVAGLAAAIEVRAGGDKIEFPENYASGVVYLTLDRAGSKQITEYYVSQEAIDAAKKGMPLPSGTVITAVAVGAQLDAHGNPAKDSNGRFIKTKDITGYRVMAKRAGWGSEYSEEKRNGEWEYQVFRADKTPNPTADLNGCFGCHKPQDKQDFVFTYDKLKVAGR